MKMGNHKKKHSEKPHFAQDFDTRFLPQEDQEKSIPLSLIIPVYNCSEAIGVTLESVQQQNYAPLEIIIVDAGSTDRTLEIVNSYVFLMHRIYTVSEYNLSDMMNKGISQASGEYIAIQLPGSYYLSKWTYHLFSEKALQDDFPDLIYCGSIQREVKREPSLVFLPFEEGYLQKGQRPAVMPACWFRHQLFEKVGKLNTRYTLRWGFDLFCRIVQENEIRKSVIDRVLVDFDYGRFSYGKILKFAAETWLILYHYFGLLTAFMWFLTLNHLLIAKGLWRRFKLHLSKP